MYEPKQIKFTYDSKTLLIKKDKEIKKDIETCKNILSDLQNVTVKEITVLEYLKRKLI